MRHHFQYGELLLKLLQGNILLQPLARSSFILSGITSILQQLLHIRTQYKSFHFLLDTNKTHQQEIFETPQVLHLDDLI